MAIEIYVPQNILANILKAEKVDCIDKSSIRRYRLI